MAAQVLARRASTALQPAARRDDADRAAAVLGRARRLRALADRAARRHTGPGRAVAGRWARHAGFLGPMPARYPSGAVTLDRPGSPADRGHRESGARIEGGVLSIDIAELLVHLVRRWWVVAAMIALAVLGAA